MNKYNGKNEQDQKYGILFNDQNKGMKENNEWFSISPIPQLRYRKLKYANLAIAVFLVILCFLNPLVEITILAPNIIAEICLFIIFVLFMLREILQEIYFYKACKGNNALAKHSRLKQIVCCVAIGCFIFNFFFIIVSWAAIIRHAPTLYGVFIGGVLLSFVSSLFVVRIESSLFDPSKGSTILPAIASMKNRFIFFSIASKTVNVFSLVLFSLSILSILPITPIAFAAAAAIMLIFDEVVESHYNHKLDLTTTDAPCKKT